MRKPSICSINTRYVGTQLGQGSRGAAGAALPLLRSGVMVLFMGPHHPQPGAGHPAYGGPQPPPQPFDGQDPEITEVDTESGGLTGVSLDHQPVLSTCQRFPQRAGCAGGTELVFEKRCPHQATVRFSHG